MTPQRIAELRGNSSWSAADQEAVLDALEAYRCVALDAVRAAGELADRLAKLEGGAT